MNEQKYPQLERLHILRTEALCSIRDRAFETLPLYLNSYSDGIVSGCQLITNRDSITLREGIIRHDNFLYLITEPMSIAYEPTNELMLLKIIFNPPLETENFIERGVELELSTNVEISDSEMELCRFKLKKGAVLRFKYTDFFDRATEFDTINIISCPYSSIGASTISPDITTAFALACVDYELDPIDYQFCLAALSGTIMTAEQLKFYISHRLNIESENWSNAQIYDYLCLILEDITEGSKRIIKGANRRRREVFIT